MFDLMPEDQMDVIPVGAVEDGCLPARESKLNFLLAQTCDPDSSAHLDRLNRAAEALSQKLNPYDLL